jgi:FtsH-binding integral membrane protein
VEETLGTYDRNHDGAALGPSVHVTDEDQRSVYPYTVTGSATFNDPAAQRQRTQMLHTTYLYLSVAVVGAMAGAWFGAHSEAYISMVFSAGWLFFIPMFFVLNMVPALALRVAEQAPRFAIPALAFDGVISGLALAPLVFVGLALSGQDAGGSGGNLVSTAVVVTGAIFAAITAYVHLNKSQFVASSAVMWGLFGFALVAMPINMMIQSSIFSMVISLVIGILGAVQLASATSTIVSNPNFNSPAAGALMLFAGLFNMFQAILHLLIGGSRD